MGMMRPFASRRLRRCKVGRGEWEFAARNRAGSRAVATAGTQLTAQLAFCFHQRRADGCIR